ncbi:hypothetical protein [Nocardia sp. NBC_00403]|uniref:hypothetical protein n=1 Tax=Nocardia sp. NBC_00403 TaxID=2975990 RepID=UPI002E1CE18D
MHPFRRTFTQLLQARFPLLYLESFEEQRALDEIVATTAALKTPRPVWRWSATDGLCRAGQAPERGTDDPVAAVRAAQRVTERAVFVLHDLHGFLGEATRPADPQVVRTLRDLVRAFRTGDLTCTAILVSPILRIPPELEKDVTVVDFVLPGEDEIRALLDVMITANADTVPVRLDDRGHDRLTRAALGLTLTEAENAFVLAMVDGGSLTESGVEVVLAEKAQTIRKSGLLEVIRTAGHGGTVAIGSGAGESAR